jgi:hypothetical protein
LDANIPTITTNNIKPKNTIVAGRTSVIIILAICFIFVHISLNISIFLRFGQPALFIVPVAIVTEINYNRTVEEFKLNLQA